MTPASTSANTTHTYRLRVTAETMMLIEAMGSERLEAVLVAPFYRFGGIEEIVTAIGREEAAILRSGLSRGGWLKRDKALIHLRKDLASAGILTGASAKEDSTDAEG